MFNYGGISIILLPTSGVERRSDIAQTSASGVPTPVGGITFIYDVNLKHSLMSLNMVVLLVRTYLDIRF